MDFTEALVSSLPIKEVEKQVIQTVFALNEWDILGSYLYTLSLRYNSSEILDALHILNEAGQQRIAAK